MRIVVNIGLPPVGAALRGIKSALRMWLLLFAASFLLQGQEMAPTLRFNQGGRFRIAQFTDLHFKYNSPSSDSALEMIKSVVAREKPDLTVLTGDMVCTADTRKAWLSLAKAMNETKVPWALVFGNHDPEFELTKPQILEAIAGQPYNLTVNGPREVSGNGNYVLAVQSASSSKAAALLYFFDSHSGMESRPDLGGYEWIDFSQIEWYRNRSREATRENKGVPLPSLAFFHIPLPEYKEVLGKSTTVGLQHESICSPELNSGLYTAMIESRDVMGVFVGHDHDNNYIGCLRNICLAYGNVSGRQCYGGIGRGARIIELREGERKFDTWILKLYECDRDKDTWVRASDDRPRYFVTYPNSFIETKPAK